MKVQFKKKLDFFSALEGKDLIIKPGEIWQVSSLISHLGEANFNFFNEKGLYFNKLENYKDKEKKEDKERKHKDKKKVEVEVINSDAEVINNESESLNKKEDEDIKNLNID